MFEGLRKKLSNAINSLVKKEEKEVREGVAEVEETAMEVKIPAAELPKTGAAHVEAQVPPPILKQPEAKKPEAAPAPAAAHGPEPAAARHHEPRPEPKAEHMVEHHAEPMPEPKREQHAARAEPRKPEPKAEPRPGPTPEHQAHAPAQQPQAKPKAAEKQEEMVRLSLATKIKSVFIRTVVLGDRELDDFLENLKVEMLQSDVSFDATEAFTESLRSNLGSAKLDSKDIEGALAAQVRKSLFELLERSRSPIDLNRYVMERVAANAMPVKVLFLGPNGTGKTTTIAKLAYNFKKNGISAVLSASDTFRAAAIEQTEHHARKAGVPVIKSNYGADPASVAFDAIAYAKSHSINVVLIDTAGRQETNRNLISEMQKIVRIAKPDITIFVGESTAGNQLSEQIREFGKFMKIDGIILTKLDCDAKGGNAISIAHTTGIPLMFIGTGESYDALIPYTPEFIVDAIVPPGKHG